ncbi:serine protease [Candidatus Falkowbacteria bacterium]|nr:serine protease [Candidatus Falkowbacteria bacterium]
MNKETKQKHWWGPVILIFFILLAGFVAGIGGELFTRYYLANKSFFSDLYFTEQASIGQKEIVINEPRKVVVEQNLRIDQIKNDIQPVLAGIYRKKTATKNILDSAFLPEDYLGQAAVLTSDGWLISTQNINVTAKYSVVVTNTKKIYEIEKVVPDASTGIVFIKINVQNLPVIKFSNNADITNGASAILYNKNSNKLELAQILNKRYKAITNKYDYIYSTQILDRLILLNKDFDLSYKGTAVFDFQGNLIGLLKSDDLVIPISYIKPIISNVLKDEKIQRPYLGLNYINIGEVNGLSETQLQNQQNGALIWSNAAGKSIASDSPLFNKLVRGDIITKIENQNIDSSNNLTDILLEYKTGQEVKIKYFKDGQEAEMSIIIQ